MNGVPPIAGLWQEARAPDGRLYYYNTQTKETSWQKPQDLMTPVERALAAQPWKEYTAPDGRKYYAHALTKQTVWEMPAEYKDALDALPAPQQPPATPTAPSTPGFGAGTSTALSAYQPRDFSSTFDSRRETITLPAVAKEVVPDYSSFEEAEAAFMKLLKRSNVQPDWSWEQAMRSTIRDPQYRALKDPKDRKAAFEKYAVEVREQEKEKAKERLAKLRTDFAVMLRTHPEIKHYSRWKTIRPIIEGETVFRSTDNEEERKQFFAEYIVELKKQHLEEEVMARKSANTELADILKALDLEPYTRWSQAQEVIQSNERVQNDAKFKLLSKSDVLNAFENHIKSLERSFNDARQQQKAQKNRRERQARDAFIELLKEKRAQGLITASTKWSNLLPHIEEDPRYVNILGQGGSSPLDLFWDMLEEEERALRGRKNAAYDVLEDKQYEVTSKTTFDEFLKIMLTDRRTANIDNDTLQLIFERLQDKIQKRNEEEKYAADKNRRRAIDALRSRIKHLEPPVKITESYEEIEPRIEKSEEYRSLDEEGRQAAFEKYIKRLKEKDEDAEKEKERRRARRSDERDYRNGHRESRRSRLSKSPEADPYEEERRRAMAARENKYRKPSFGLSPPRTAYRDGRDRDERHGRLERSPPPRPAPYDRDRRDRDDERERLYRTRADPRGSRDELNYGEESRSVTSERRRRRDSPGESVDSSRQKRRRRDSRGSRERRRTKTPEIKKEEPEAAGVHSGSEEGEIEED
ncbi:U1 snRNP protein [Lithohypha guttulata]|uniref:U1 snRNP protein n=1 Tax=Lithohypha guttulata TaxID=1690604 RepID=UPI002DE01335|nr:U1 snRNP protein [Lithohypha guttulata]KAK5104159.1 U1 snRNP protein [Lithohypha guttulata]